MFIKEIILACYILCIAGIVAGVTCGVLSHIHKKTQLNKAAVMFLAGMFVICFYDMAIYYCNYVIGILSSMEVMRIGNCLIAVTMFFWLGLQKQILDRDAIHFLDGVVRKYMLIYAAVWFILTIAMPVDYFYTVKWLLLITDIFLIVGFLASSVAHSIYTSVSGMRNSTTYMLITTAMLLWNYFSYFWGEASVYWGNSRFIREPLDLTIIFWLVISIMTAMFVYHQCFKPTFIQNAPPPKERRQNTIPSHTDIRERIETVGDQYNLTKRERELVELIYQGKSNKEIAESLFLSESTVKTHVYNIFRKMEVKNRIEVICIVNEENK
ncbi:MAG: response regulator transcription factor [Bacillota bacterium]|nr:response regulator transcription factor [Bacillota bacterium]